MPLYANVERTPEYLANTTARVTTESFYWASRVIAALADAHFGDTIPAVERYQQKTLAAGHALVLQTDASVDDGADADAESDDSTVPERLAAANDAIAATVKAETDALLGTVLFTASNGMANRFSRSDG